MISWTRLLLISAPLVGGLPASACDVTGTQGPAVSGSDFEPGEPIYRLRGTWLAVDLIVSSEADSSYEISLVPQGAVFSLRIHDDQTYVLLSSLTGGPADREQGTLSVGDSTLTLRAEHIQREPRVFTYGWRFERLTLWFLQDFDFDRDGVGEAARFYAELVDLEFGLGPTFPDGAPGRAHGFDRSAWDRVAMRDPILSTRGARHSRVLLRQRTTGGP